MHRAMLVLFLSIACGCGGGGGETAPPATSAATGVPTANMLSCEIPVPEKIEDPLGMGTRGSTGSSLVNTLIPYNIVNEQRVHIAIIEEMAKLPPTSSVGKTTIWETASTAAVPIIWRLSSEKKSATTFAWKLEARAAGTSDTAMRLISSGTHTQGASAGAGSGTFSIDYKALNSLPGFDFGGNIEWNATVSASVSYSYVGRAEGSSVEVSRSVTTYRGPIKTVLKCTGDMDGGGSTDSVDYIIRSSSETATGQTTYRWTSSGAGRADTKLLLGSEFKVSSECWDKNLRSTWFSSTSMVIYGTESIDCAFGPTN